MRVVRLSQSCVASLVHRAFVPALCSQVVGFGCHQYPQVISGKSIAHLRGVGKVRAPQTLVMIAARKLLRASVANDPPRACDVVYYFGHSSVQVCRLSFTSSRCEAALKDWRSTGTERVDSHGEKMASHRVRPVRISDRACATERSLKLRKSIHSPPLLRELGPDTRFVATESNISY